MAHMDDRLVEILQCPSCRGDEGVEYKDRRRVIRCLDCERTYPVLDGIPVMLVEASTAARHASGGRS